MRTLVLDTSVGGIDEVLERRRRLGQDRHDEIWDGVLHVSPNPSGAHSQIQVQLIVILQPLAKAAGLWVTADFNLGTGLHNYRVPDGGLHRQRPNGLYMQTAALVFEVLLPYDESWEKLPFYAASGVDEAVLVDPGKHEVYWLKLRNEQSAEPITHSSLIALGPSALADQLDWPPLDRLGTTDTKS